MFKRAQPTTVPAVLTPAQLPATTAEEIYQRGWAYYAVGDYPHAETDLREALHQDQNNMDAYYALGMTLKITGDKTGALAAFQQVAALSQLHSDSVRGRMVRRLALGHIHEIETGDWNLEKEIWQFKK
jgi:tetratricopeptide (TPR) repeat protein